MTEKKTFLLLAGLLGLLLVCAFLGNPQKARGEELNGGVGLTLESGLIRRGVLLHTGMGQAVYAGVGDENLQVSFWADRAVGFAENGVQLGLGNDWVGLNLVGYSDQKDASTDGVAEVHLGLHRDKGAGFRYDLRAIGQQSALERVNWAVLSLGYLKQTQPVDLWIDLKFNGQDSKLLKSAAHSTELHLGLSVPLVGGHLELGGMTSAPSSTLAKEVIIAQSGSGTGSYSALYLGVGYVF
ncbi:MAG: hypothetical protein A2600_09930 [Candidatus Lambdaproteobacteria bacterium RIFOXYD1_FULL_56_27]|uniref:Uncharacterized protein n=1 Tax=Candidatus Lambdaproteobacteria bacterium RIFOXYD2_FULL_56_26 TaxID=1817773 RepID=A0A1F6GU47_9PROT|nr:MAG: hypothetical protein A2557_11760 [Candidatus Lambdaproteobacteria bacterium RIFOXYD2_FULL_56_26]OGH04336.1 MAG: hypothetical protein A2426_05785 [Candidatus Lambdaproteobacteria bacterium RIFOXYC1_FULL_56_13]OGH07398.1 MAG: hypothetical protein A2600_09930 [Candidatus Lambdaproteobacteria bacterium RIFOXYD1_FULL_56_27]